MNRPVFTGVYMGNGGYVILRDNAPMTAPEVIGALEDGQRALDLLRLQRERYESELTNLRAGVDTIFRISPDLV